MSSDESYKHYFPVEVNFHYKSITVSFDIKNNSVISYNTCISELGFDLIKAGPVFIPYDFIPASYVRFE